MLGIEASCALGSVGTSFQSVIPDTNLLCSVSLCLMPNVQHTKDPHPKTLAEPGTLCSIFMMKYRFPIKSKTSSFQKAAKDDTYKNRGGGAESSWLNLGR